jgi:hypothetical protein
VVRTSYNIFASNFLETNRVIFYAVYHTNIEAQISVAGVRTDDKIITFKIIIN